MQQTAWQEEGAFKNLTEWSNATEKHSITPFTTTHSPSGSAFDTSSYSSNSLYNSLADGLHEQMQIAKEASYLSRRLIKSQILQQGHLSPWRDSLLSLYKHCSSLDAERIEIRKNAQFLLDKVLEDEDWMATSLKHTLSLQAERHSNSGKLSLLLQRLVQGEDERILLETKLKDHSLQSAQQPTPKQSTESLKAAVRKKQVILDELKHYQSLFKKRADQLHQQRKTAEEKVHNQRINAGVTPEELQGLEQKLASKSSLLHELTGRIREQTADMEEIQQAESLAKEVKALEGQASKMHSYSACLADVEEASTLSLKVWTSLGQLEGQIAHAERAIIQLEMMILQAEAQSNIEEPSADSALALETRLAEVNQTLEQIFAQKQQLLDLTLGLDEKIRGNLEVQAKVAAELAMLRSNLQGLHSQLAEKARESFQLQAKVQELKAEGQKEQGQIQRMQTAEQLPKEVRQQLCKELEEWRKVEVLKRLCRNLRTAQQQKARADEQESIMCLLQEHLIKLG
jgi:hypothetical protein